MLKLKPLDLNTQNHNKNLKDKLFLIKGISLSHGYYVSLCWCTLAIFLACLVIFSSLGIIFYQIVQTQAAK